MEQARAELADELASLDGTLDTVISAAEIAPPLLGVDEPKRYFVAILNPNESRGVGGFLGTWAIMTADSGRLTIDEVGSNNDLPELTTLPIDLGDDFQAHYGDGAGNIANFNISPHFPNAARLWLASWEEKTGERLDGALSADVVALGQLVTASGGSVRLPDGGSLTGAELTEFALAGIYEKFPDETQSTERKEYQEAVASEAAKAVTAGGAREPRGDGHRPGHGDLRAAGAGLGRGQGPPGPDHQDPLGRVAGSAGWATRGVRGHQLLDVEAGHLPRALRALRRGAGARTSRAASVPWSR